MRTSLISAALLMAAMGVAASPVWRSETTTVELFDRPCADSSMVARLTLQPPTNKVSSAIVVYKGRILSACWTTHPDRKHVIVLDAEGDIGTLEIREFENDKGALK